MAIATDIVQSWRTPRAVLRRRLDTAREADALAVLMMACGLIFVSQWPGLARAAHLDPSIPLDARLGGAMMGAVFLLPPLAYGLAALSHLVARALGGKGDWLGARMALFWALLSVSPLMLLQGLVAGFIGHGPALTLVGAIVGLVFLLQWGMGLIEAERG